MSNTTTTPDLTTPSPTPTTTSTPNVSTTPSTTESPTTTTPPITTTTTTPTTVSTSPSPTPSTTSSSSSEITSSTTRSQSVFTSVIIQTPSNGGDSVSTVIITSTDFSTRASSSTTSSTRSAGASASIQPTSDSSSGGLTGGGKIAVAVVVPIVAVALLVLAGLFFWRRRKQRKDAEELRRKEVEEYGFNPNNDPTLPAVGAAGVAKSGNDGYEMREDGSSGYRGWGTTAVASSGRKPSTTMSGPSAGAIGMAYSDTSPTHGPVSDRSDHMMLDGRPLSPESEALGAMGPSSSNNRGADINRGPSNASSSYSAANRSDASGEGQGYAPYNNQYDTGNPYDNTPYGSPPARAEMSGQPVIRDVQARRNTRIENPSHFPQQSAGISQNF